LNELKCLLQAATKNRWDLFQIPGSPTGAIGLVQFEPSSFQVAVDGDGDGSIDLFSPEDAILSIAHYLTTRGWDSEPRHQQRTVYAHYGGRYDADPKKYYMKAVLRYAQEVDKYFQTHPIEPVLHLPALPLPMLEDQASRFAPYEQSGN
jgi:membrane-bound lytic murein transglycosylase B